MQLDYNANPKGYAGMIADSATRDTDSPLAQSDVTFGLGVVSDVYETCRLPTSNRGTIVFSGAVVTSNKIDGTVNGVAISQVTFATDAATTYALVAAQVVAVLTSLGITATTSINSNTITVTTAAGEALAFSSFLVTLGASQATVSHVYSDTGVFRGIAVAGPQGIAASTGTAVYRKGVPVNVLRRGRAYVPVVGDVAYNASLYLILTGADTGKFTSTAGSNLATAAKAVEAITGGTIGKIELNLP